jgi:hypothetical protein
MVIWLILAFGMKTPPSVKTKMYHINELDEQNALALAGRVAAIAGVQESVAIADENMLIVKINNQLSKESQLAIEQAILKLIGSK